MADNNTGAPRPSLAGGMFRRKSVAQVQAEYEGGELKRSLGAWNLILLGIGCIIGTGIFVLTGRAAAVYAGPGIMISFIITGTLCAFVALCYAELASVLPVSGSAYSYSYASMGEFIAWVMGLLLILEYGLAASTVAAGWSGYVVSFLHHELHVDLPHAFTQAPGMWVATSAIDSLAQNALVDIAGAKATLADGTLVTFPDHTMVNLAQGLPVKFDAYDVVSQYAYKLPDGAQATLAGAAQVVNAATKETLPLDAGAMITLPAGENVTMLADAVRQLVGGSIVASSFNLPAMIGIVAVTLLLVVGINESATVNNIVVFIKVAVVLAFIAIGIFYVNFDNWHPLVPERVSVSPAGVIVPDPAVGGFWEELKDAFVAIFTGDDTNRYGIGGVIHAAAVIFFAYIGFEAVSTAGAEAKNPSRDMPIGIIGSLLICTILYILTAGVLVGIVPYSKLDNPAPIALAVNEIGLPWFATLIKVGAIAGLSSVMLVLCYGQTRIFYSMARDGLLPPFFSTVHKRFKTPWINTLIVGLLAGAGASLMSLDALSNLTNVGTLAAFMIVCITVIYMRFAAPNLARPFRAPLGLATPILGTLMCFILLMSLMTHDLTRHFFLIYLGVGAVAYFFYGFWFSKLGRAKR